jgi:ABC-type phosphate transport system substrate-binding protein
VQDNPLVLTMEILSDIYLGKIANWRDTKILSINQPIAGLIPNKSIIVVVPTVRTPEPRSPQGHHLKSV